MQRLLRLTSVGTLAARGVAGCHGAHRPAIGAVAFVQRRLLGSASVGDEDRQREVHARSVRDPEGFWGEAAKAIAWTKPPAKVLDSSRPPFYRWFPDGALNACYNAVDRHVDEGNGARVAVYYDSPVTRTAQSLTYAALKDKVARAAGMLRNHGVKKGDTVIVYMPMIPETLVAMLACARIGAVHVVVFGGFAPKELAKRIEDAEPKVVLTASCGVEPKGVIAYKPLLDEAISLSAAKPAACIVFQRPQLAATLQPGRDHDWEAEFAKAKPQPCVPVEAGHPLYSLYTSGTTGRPKGVVRDHGGYCVALKWTMANVYNVKPGEVFWGASDFGWVVGHSYIAYGPLLHGCSTVIYEGKPIGTPDAGAFWRVVAQYGVSCLFTAPTVLRTLKREDPQAAFMARHPMPSLRALFLAGERSDTDSLRWAAGHLGVPVVDHWWMTETGWAITSQCLALSPPAKIRVGAAGRSVPGFQVELLSDEGKPVPPNAFGNIAIRLPLPPGSLLTVWKDDERFRSAYMKRFPGYFDTGDAGLKDADDYVFVMSRTDDLINVAGHRLSTGTLEEVLSGHPKVAEVAVIAADDAMKGVKPLGFLVLKSGVSAAAEGAALIKETIEMVRRDVGAFACYDKAYVVNRLPKTRSGKVLRRTLRSIANGEKYDVPATIEDASVLQEIEAVVGGKRSSGMA